MHCRGLDLWMTLILICTSFMDAPLSFDKKKMMMCTQVKFSLIYRVGSRCLNDDCKATNCPRQNLKRLKFIETVGCSKFAEKTAFTILL